jgi:hypothetical protein
LAYTASPADVGVPIFLVLGATLLGWLFLRFVFKNGRKAAILVALALGLFFFYGRFSDALTVAGVVDTFSLYTRRLVLMWLAWSLPVAFLVIRAKSDLLTLTNLLNVVAGVLVIIQLGNIAVYQITPNDPTGHAASDPVIGSTKEVIVKPDIYYIILDAYTSSRNLTDIFGYDNSPFDDFLTSRDFYVAADSRSNYGTTQMSLSSSLNMEHLLQFDGHQYALVYVDFLKENAVMKFLRDLDYQVFHFKERWMSDLSGSYTDSYIGCENQQGLFSVGGSNLWKLNDFSIALVQTTLLDPFLREFGAVAPRFRSEALCDFQKLEGIIDHDGPKFVFAHMLGAHPPFVFGPEGGVPPSQVKFLEYESELNYLGQLAYNNLRMREIIDEILANSEIPPVIILQGDHGPGFYGEDPTETGIRERFPILNAFHLPDGGDDDLYTDITPVNTFRVIFNHYFGTKLQLMDDKSYFTETAESGGVYEDVTGIAIAPWPDRN